LKETGIRAREEWQIERTEIDVEDRTIRVKPEKGSNPRGSKNLRETWTQEHKEHPNLHSTTAVQRR
jgi:hypothetical protein